MEKEALQTIIEANIRGFEKEIHMDTEKKSAMPVDFLVFIAKRGLLKIYEKALTMDNIDSSLVMQVVVSLLEINVKIAGIEEVEKEIKESVDYFLDYRPKEMNISNFIDICLDIDSELNRNFFKDHEELVKLDTIKALSMHFELLLIALEQEAMKNQKEEE